MRCLVVKEILLIMKDAANPLSLPQHYSRSSAKLRNSADIVHASHVVSSKVEQYEYRHTGS